MLSRIMNRLRPTAGEQSEDDRDMAAGARIIIGLGNPGRNYANTRHNLGFMVVDELARRGGESTARKRFRSEMVESRFPTGKTILVKPQTYMNESGHAVREVLNWYRADPEQLLIVVDDLDLPFGQLRLRPSGSAGGHNGLKSIIEQTGTREFPRLRVGIGRGPNQAKAHVLSHFAPTEQQSLLKLIDAAADATELWMREGIITAMNEINGRASAIEEQAGTPNTSA
jgi:peptidyl-tRNA hydrolase, PTH1 family